MLRQAHRIGADVRLPVSRDGWDLRRRLRLALQHVDLVVARIASMKPSRHGQDSILLNCYRVEDHGTHGRAHRRTAERRPSPAEHSV